MSAAQKNHRSPVSQNTPFSLDVLRTLRATYIIVLTFTFEVRHGICIAAVPTAWTIPDLLSYRMASPCLVILIVE